MDTTNKTEGVAYVTATETDATTVQSSIEGDTRSSESEDNKPFKCGYCDKAYRAHKDLKRHDKGSLCAKKRPASSTLASALPSLASTWCCSRCYTRFNTRFSTQRHINETCWKSCDECCGVGELHCDGHTSESDCFRCQKLSQPCSKRTEPVEGCVPVAVSETSQQITEKVKATKRGKRKATKSPEDTSKPSMKNQRPTNVSDGHETADERADNDAQSKSKDDHDNPSIIRNDSEPQCPQHILQVAYTAPLSFHNQNTPGSHQAHFPNQIFARATAAPPAYSQVLPPHMPQIYHPISAPREMPRPLTYSAFPNAEQWASHTHMLQQQHLQQSQQPRRWIHNEGFTASGHTTAHNGHNEHNKQLGFNDSQDRPTPPIGNTDAFGSGVASTSDNPGFKIYEDRTVNPPHHERSGVLDMGHHQALGHATLDTKLGPGCYNNGHPSDNPGILGYHNQNLPVRVMPSALPTPDPNDPTIVLRIVNIDYDPYGQHTYHNFSLRRSQKFGPHLNSYCEQRGKRYLVDWQFAIKCETPTPQNPKAQKLFVLKWNVTPNDIKDDRNPDVYLEDGHFIHILTRNEKGTYTIGRELMDKTIQYRPGYTTHTEPIHMDEWSHNHREPDLRARCDHLETVNIGLRSENQKLISENTGLRKELADLRYDSSGYPNNPSAPSRGQSGSSHDASKRFSMLASQANVRAQGLIHRSGLPPPNRQLWPSASLSSRSLQFQDIASVGVQQRNSSTPSSADSVHGHIHDAASIKGQANDDIKEAEEMKVRRPSSDSDNIIE